MPDSDKTTTDLTGGTSVLGETPATAAPQTAEPSLSQDTPEFDTAATTEEAPKADRFAHVRGEAESIRTQATERLYAFAGTGKDSAVDFIDTYIETIRDAANKVEEFAGPQVAQYVHQVADYAGDFSTRLREADIDELLDEGRNLVRRSPAIAIGAAATIGFGLSRFLKATSERLEPDFAAQTAPRRGADGAPAYDA